MEKVLFLGPQKDKEVVAETYRKFGIYACQQKPYSLRGKLGETADPYALAPLQQWQVDHQGQAGARPMSKTKHRSLIAYYVQMMGADNLG